MITEIEVADVVNGYELCVTFRIASKNDGGQSDLISPAAYYIDGDEYGTTDDVYDRNIAAFLDDMYANYEKYPHTVKEIKNESEYD